MKRFIKALTLFVMILVLATGCQKAAPGAAKGPDTAKDSNEQEIETASTKLVSTVNKGGYEPVSTKDLNSWVEQEKDMAIVDTIPTKSFDKSRISGTVNVELPMKADELRPEQKEAFLKVLGEDKSETIVVYCGFADCARNDIGAVLAKEAGFINAYRHPGGTVVWMDAGYKAEGSAAR